MPVFKKHSYFPVVIILIWLGAVKTIVRKCFITSKEAAYGLEL